MAAHRAAPPSVSRAKMNADFLSDIKVISAEQANEVKFVVCIRKGADGTRYFSDNLEGICNDCGVALVFRPYTPLKPPYLCIECMFDRAGVGRA